MFYKKGKENLLMRFKGYVDHNTKRSANHETDIFSYTKVF